MRSEEEISFERAASDVHIRASIRFSVRLSDRLKAFDRQRNAFSVMEASVIAKMDRRTVVPSSSAVSHAQLSRALNRMEVLEQPCGAVFVLSKQSPVELDGVCDFDREQSVSPTKPVAFLYHFGLVHTLTWLKKHADLLLPCVAGACFVPVKHVRLGKRLVS